MGVVLFWCLSKIGTLLAERSKAEARIRRIEDERDCFRSECLDAGYHRRTAKSPRRGLEDLAASEIYAAGLILKVVYGDEA